MNVGAGETAEGTAVEAASVAAAPRSFVTLRRCPGCASSAIAFDLKPNLWRCRGCALRFINPQPSLERVRAYQDSGLTYRRFAAEHAARERIWAARLRLVQRFRATGRLLDVGTGDGHFLLHAQSAFDTEGSELSLAGVELARARGLRVHHGALTELSLADAAYDVVTLWHVFEHLPQPSEELARIRSLLAPAGRLVVAVPNEQLALDLCRWGRRRNSPFWPYRSGDEIHLAHFTAPVLRGVLQRNGFDLVALGADDVDVDATLISRTREAFRRSSGWALGRRWSSAIVAVARSR